MKNKRTIYVTKGLPGSGKTFWSKAFIDEQRGKDNMVKRVNKDDLRAMLDNSHHSKGRESFILNMRNTIIRRTLREGYDIIVDDTNLNPIHLEAIEDIVAKDFDGDVDIVVKDFTDVPPNVCLRRDMQRPNPVGAKVIYGMYEQYLVQKKIVVDPGLPTAILVDMDSTLCIRNGRSPYDYRKVGEDIPNQPIVDLVKSIYTSPANQDIRVFICTARENLMFDDVGATVKDLTMEWLTRHKIFFDDIFIREQGDHRSDHIVKREIYEERVEGLYNVLYVIDDRKQVVDMWRGLGLTVLDIAGHEF